jgi:hypothetical protein
MSAMALFLVPDLNGAGGVAILVAAAVVLTIGLPVVVGLMWRFADHRKQRHG